MPRRNDYGIEPAENDESPIPIVEDVQATDSGCLNLYYDFCLSDLYLYLISDQAVWPAVVSGRARFKLNEAGVLLFDCFDAKFPYLVHTAGLSGDGISGDEILEDGTFALECNPGTVPMVIHNVPDELLPRNGPPQYVSRNKGFCVNPFLAFFYAAMLFEVTCVESQFFAWDVLQGLEVIVAWATRTEGLYNVGTGERGPSSPVEARSSEVPKLELMLVSDYGRTIRLKQIFHASAAVWNNTLSGSATLWSSTSHFRFRVCVTLGWFEVNVNLNAVWSSLFLAALPEELRYPPRIGHNRHHHIELR